MPDACSPSAGIAGGHQVRATTHSQPHRAHGDGDGVGREGKWGGKQSELPIHPSAHVEGPEPQTALLVCRCLLLPLLSSEAWTPPQCVVRAMRTHRGSPLWSPALMPSLSGSGPADGQWFMDGPLPAPPAPLPGPCMGAVALGARLQFAFPPSSLFSLSAVERGFG